MWGIPTPLEQPLRAMRCRTLQTGPGALGYRAKGYRWARGDVVREQAGVLGVLRAANRDPELVGLGEKPDGLPDQRSS